MELKEAEQRAAASKQELQEQQERFQRTQDRAAEERAKLKLELQGLTEQKNELQTHLKHNQAELEDTIQMARRARHEALEESKQMVANLRYALDHAQEEVNARQGANEEELARQKAQYDRLLAQEVMKNVALKEQQEATESALKAAEARAASVVDETMGGKKHVPETTTVGGDIACCHRARGTASILDGMPYDELHRRHDALYTENKELRSKLTVAIGQLESEQAEIARLKGLLTELEAASRVGRASPTSGDEENGDQNHAISPPTSGGVSKTTTRTKVAQKRDMIGFKKADTDNEAEMTSLVAGPSAAPIPGRLRVGSGKCFSLYFTLTSSCSRIKVRCSISS